MNQRMRKLAGLVAIVVFLTVYCLAAMAVGGQYVVGLGMAAELPFYAVAGFAWLPPVMLLIRWMSAPDKA